MSSETFLTTDHFFAALERLYRPAAQPDREAMATGVERGRRSFARFLFDSLCWDEGRYKLLRSDLHRLEQRLDQLHVSIDRHQRARFAERLDDLQFKYDQLTAARDRLSNYLHDVDARLNRDAVGDRREELHEYCVELQARTLELKAPLELCGRRLAAYSAQIAVLEASR